VKEEFERAEKAATALQHAADTPETARLARQASLARKVSDLLRDKDYAEARRVLSADRADFDEAVHKKMEARARDLRTTIRQKMLNEASESLAAAELGLKTNPDPRGVETSRRLSEAEASANQVIQLFDGRRPGQEDAEAFNILGRIAELRADPVSAYAAYSSALAEPERADLAKLPILLSRLEFITNPRWKKHLTDLDAYHPRVFIRYADRAVALVTQNPSTDAMTKARAYAASAIARILASEAEPPGAEEARERQRVAIIRLELALKDYGRDPRPWRWRYELARLLKAKMLESTPEERKDLRDRALKEIEDALDAGPPAADRDKLLIPLKKQLLGMK